jgi:polyhydroxyalkanoate synthesis regulator phasin
MKYTLGQAAKATGKAKTTISNAVKQGRLSAEKNNKGEYEIDAAELHRVYAPVESASKVNAVQPPSNTAEIDALNAQVAMLTDMLERERANADEWRKQAQTLALAAPERRSIWMRLLGKG